MDNDEAIRGGVEAPLPFPTQIKAERRVGNRYIKVYTDEFKAKAVRSVVNGKSASDVARDLDVDKSLVARWAREAGYGRKKPTESKAKAAARARAGIANSPAVQKAPDSGEAQRLRNELAKINSEIELMKKMLLHYIS